MTSWVKAVRSDCNGEEQYMVTSEAHFSSASQ